jgi:hypothetical protein
MLTRENFLYAPVDVPDWQQIQKEMLLFRTRLGTPDGWMFGNVEDKGALSFMPTLAKWFKSENMEMTECVYIITPAHVITNVHRDLFGLNELALNFPVQGYENIRTHWYKELIDLPFIQPGPNPHHIYKPNEIEEYDSTCVDVPTLMNVHVLHSVNNLTDQNRIVFSFRFREAPWHLVGL